MALTITGTYYTRSAFDSFETETTKCALIKNNINNPSVNIDIAPYTVVITADIESHNDIRIVAKTVILFGKLKSIIGHISVTANRLYLFNTELDSPFDFELKCTDILVSESEQAVTNTIKQIFLSAIPGQPGCHLIHGLVACYFNLFGLTDDKKALYHFELAHRPSPAPAPLPSPSAISSVDSVASLASSLVELSFSSSSSIISSSPAPTHRQGRGGGGLPFRPVFRTPGSPVLDDIDDDTSPSTAALRPPLPPEVDAMDPALEALLNALRNYARYRERTLEETPGDAEAHHD